MKNLISRILGTGLMLGLVVSGHARQPMPAVVPAVTANTKGKVLIFKTERTLSGEIELVGDRYRVRRVIGETWIPADQVQALCGSLVEAYEFLRGRANLNDTAERLRIAEWCRQHDLRDQAIIEIREASHLRPQDERIRRMLAHLEATKTRPAQTAEAAKEAPAPRVEVTAESATQFATRVQPILMNACVKCHNTGRGGRFQLTHITGSGLADRRTMEKNLSAVLDQINAREPRLSKLLTKSINIHGRDMNQAPLNGRNAVAFRTLEQWVDRTVEGNPQLAERSVIGSSAVAPPSASASASPKTGDRWGADRVVDPRPTTPPASPSTPPPVNRDQPGASWIHKTLPSSPTPTKPATAPTGVSDPVDPEGFNREFHAPPTPIEERRPGT